MGIFGGAARRERHLQQLQDRVNTYSEQALSLWRAGRADQALLHNQQAIDTIRELQAEEPDNEQHLAQLAGKLYNHAGMLTQAGRLNEAVEAARACLQKYLDLTGGEIGPATLLDDRLAGLSHSLRPTLRRNDLPRLVSMTADAKMRLATALALADPTGNGAEARRFATQAVDSYQQLRSLDQRYEADLMRVVQAKAEILQLLGLRPSS